MSASDKQLIALSSMSIGQKALIMGFSLNAKEGERIQGMGLSAGEHLEVVRLPPLKDHIEIKIRGYFVSLRKQEAARIKVKLLP